MSKKIQNSPGRYINPFTDFGFKRLFGEEPNKDLLIDFLNELLKSQNQQIKTLTYKKTEQLGTTDLDRKVIFDLYCENEKGEKFIVELQKAKQSFFKDRALFYSTFPIQEQGVKGHWNYELKAVYAIAILDFRFDDHDKDKTIVKDTNTPKQYINQVQLMETKQKVVFYNKLTYVYIQMPNFTKTIDELKTHLDRWLYVLKHLGTFDRIPEKIKDKIFNKLFQIAEYENLSKEDRTSYEDSLKYYRDLKNSFDTAEEDGRTKERKMLAPIIEEALAREQKAQREKEAAQKEKGIAQREKEAALAREQKAQQEKEAAQQEKHLAQQEKENAQEKIIDLAKMLKGLKVPTEEIAEKTGLSPEEIEKL